MHSFLLLSCVVASSLGQADALAIENIRPTYGYLGAPIPKSDGRLPGDIIYFTFDIKNLKLDAAGRATYSMMVEVLDAKGKLTYKIGPTNSVAQNYLGGNTLPCSAHLEIPHDATPGEHLFRLTLQDRTTKQQVVIEKKGNVLPLDFGIVQVGTSADRSGHTPIPPVGVVGQALYLNFATVGFKRDEKSNQPDVEVSMKILENGKTVQAKPLTGRVHEEVPATLRALPLQFGITLNRAGSFTVELKAEDKRAGKTSTVTFPLRVLAASGQ